MAIVNYPCTGKFFLIRLANITLNDFLCQVLKHTTFTKCSPQGVEFVAECVGCNNPKRTSACSTCQRPVLFCALCCLPIKGASSACLVCGHGGHLIHMMRWFEVKRILFL